MTELAGTLKMNALMRRTAYCALAGTLAACTTEPVELESMHIEGRVYDVESLIGLEGVGVALLHGAGAFGTGSSGHTVSDATGDYVIIVEFDSPRLCQIGTYDLGVVLPDGYEPDLDEFEPLECIETVQYRDLRMRPTAGGG